MLGLKYTVLRSQYLVDGSKLSDLRSEHLNLLAEHAVFLAFSE